MIKDLIAVILGRQTEGQVQAQKALNAQHLASTKRIHELTGSVACLQEEHDTLHRCIRQRGRMIEKLSGELLTTKEKLTERQAEVRDLKRTITTTKEEMKALGACHG